MYKVVIAAPNTGQIYNSNGTLFIEELDGKKHLPEFRTLKRAQLFGRSLVRRYPYLECVVLDETGREVARHQNADWLQREAKRRQSMQQLYSTEQKNDTRKFLLSIALSLLFTSILSIVLLKQGIRSELILIVAVIVPLFVWSLIINRY